MAGLVVNIIGLYTNLVRHIEIMEEHARYFHPINAFEMATCLMQVLNDPDRDVKIKNAKDYIILSKFRLNMDLMH